MRRFIVSAAALVGLLAASGSASAQHNKNVIVNSGNGVNNTVVARNAPASILPGGCYPGGCVPGPYYPGGGFNKNVISDSGNGIGNTVIATNGGGFWGSYPGGGVFPGGVNVNVITN